MPPRGFAGAVARGQSDREARETGSLCGLSRRDRAQMIELGGKWSDFATRLFRRDADRPAAAPSLLKNVAGEPRQQVRRQRGFLQREGMVGAGNDDERAVGNVRPQGFVQSPRRKEIEFA